MNRVARDVAQRLSLRSPQKSALEILDRIAELIPLAKGVDLDVALKSLQAEYPNLQDFEREFPSVCFALATGVGKTRLMGAFIAFLAQALGMHNFLVLAPSLTIYDKLRVDFTPNTPKYVFQGIGYFATQPPILITGDDYEKRMIEEEPRMARTRSDAGPAQMTMTDVLSPVRINIFNIAKLNRDASDKKGAPRIKRLSEYIGKSYFDYLAGLDDLVILMDESHRYRADAGVRALNELRPVLGLELTATPQVESGKNTIPFKNVIYSYSLAAALNDGFVKQPAVATRENFDASQYTEEALEQLKLEDAVRVHEDVKMDLDLYHRETGAPLIKPFILVIAKDTEHAGRIEQFIKGTAFFNGRYAAKVIQVHSEQRGEEKDENVKRLLAVEQADEPTEIVIHVNMLKEGWDVTNLYTIVPLRKADSKTLVEQSIGRGLRLPFGRRVADPNRKSLDRLTIIAHDRFQDIIDEAEKTGSKLKFEKVILDGNRPQAGQTIVASPSTFEAIMLSEPATETNAGGTVEALAAAKAVVVDAPTLALRKQIVQALITVARSSVDTPVVASLNTPKVKDRIKAYVRGTATGQFALPMGDAAIDT